MPAHPDPTFHASAKLAMQAPPEKLAYTVMLSPDLYQEIWAVGEWAMAAEKFADIGPARERGGRCPQIGASPSPRPPKEFLRMECGCVGRDNSQYALHCTAGQPYVEAATARA